MVTVYTYSEPVNFPSAPVLDAFYGIPVAFLDGTYGIRQYTERFNWDTRTPELSSSVLSKFDVISGKLDAGLPMSLLGDGLNLPMVQMLDGRFLEQGHDNATATIPQHSFLQFRSADGTLAGHKINLQGPGISGSDVNDIAVLPNGGFVATWYQYDPAHAATGWDIASQVFNKHGRPVSDVLTLADAGYQSPPMVAVLSPTRFVEVWVDSNAGWSLKAKVYDVSGDAITDTLTLRTVADNYSGTRSVVALANGNFAVMWAEESSDLVHETRKTAYDVQVFSASGSAVSGVVTFASMAVGNNSMNYLGVPNLIALQDGRFAVAWTESIGAPDNEYSRQFYSSYLLQVYEGNGKAASPIYGLGPNDGFETGVGIVALSDGRIAATWSQFNPDIRDTQQTTQILDPRDHGIDLTGNALNNQYVGTTYDDRIYGLAGADTLFGDAGNDVLNGGTGNDMLLGGYGADKLFGTDGNDYLSGFDGDDRLVGGRGNDLELGGRGRDVFVFAPGDGQDKIKGFVDGQDRIDLSAYHFAHGWTALRHFSEVSSGVTFVDGADTILIAGLTMAELSAADLIWA